MTDLRQAAQEALEALEYASTGNRRPEIIGPAIVALRTALAQQQAEPVVMRMPKVGDKVICLEDESLGTVESLTAGGSPDITFDDGFRGTYLLREFAELFGYVSPPQRQWVELTDDDFCDQDQEWIAGASWAEAKLKERNT